eukprot:TRINITY_DN6710_c0_g1_i1.p1 TRINITY_DN6710_c0_g1~~TRINITY_DN6710_c0_g1_i1.p1  ORF type:complete len:505 (-),score=142.40 TRINITY_DN6710_c0_g1_i1:78-1592(-)
MTDKTALGISVVSLNPADHEGWAIKEGGSWNSWKKRWFVLKDKRLWYFAGKADAAAKGFIEIDGASVVASETGNKKHKFMFSITSRGAKGARKFRISPDTQQDVTDWMTYLKKAIDKQAGIAAAGGAAAPAVDAAPATTTPATPAAPADSAAPGAAPAETTPAAPGATPVTPTPAPTATTPATAGTTPVAGAAPATPKATVFAPGSVRAKLSDIQAAVDFMHTPDGKVMEFWKLWTESIPPKEEVPAGQSIEFQVAASVDLEKLSWRTSGPQSVVIQKMVDFFWNVGAPDSEIDKLNDVGAVVNPLRIGSWIDMSAKTGMDGGWFFPVDVPPKSGIEAADVGEASQKLLAWCEGHQVIQCYNVGRDMGAAPPRQTEMKMRLPGDFTAAFTLALDAFSSFGMPALPDAVVTAVRASPCESISLSVITTNEGFVRIGVLLNKPAITLVHLLVDAHGNKEKVAKLEAAVGEPPAVLELVHLKAGYGYGVYKEGFDVMLHWHLPQETN